VNFDGLVKNTTEDYQQEICMMCFNIQYVVTCQQIYSTYGSFIGERKLF